MSTGKIIAIAAGVGLFSFVSGVLTESGFHADGFRAAKGHYEPICVASLTSTPDEAMKDTPETEKVYITALCTAYMHGAERAINGVRS